MKEYPFLQVQCDDKQLPSAIYCQNRFLQVVARLEYWHDTGCWWCGESEKYFHRLILEDQSVREIFYDLAQQEWFLYKTYD